MNKEMNEEHRKMLAEQLMKMPELEQKTSGCEKCGENWITHNEDGSCVQDEELIHKRMNDINTFQAHENELYLRGTDEDGKDFQICFDSYNFLEWIDTEHLKYIKKQLIKFIKTK